MLKTDDPVWAELVADIKACLSRRCEDGFAFTSLDRPDQWDFFTTSGFHIPYMDRRITGAQLTRVIDNGINGKPQEKWLEGVFDEAVLKKYRLVSFSTRTHTQEARQYTQPIELVEGQLLRDLQELTSRQFVYEDGWCGMVPFSGELTELQTGPPVSCAELTGREQADVLRSFIHWDGYPERDWNDEYTIRENIAAGKQPDQWLEDTSLHKSFRLLAEGKTPPPARQCPEISELEVLDALGLDASGAKAKDENVPEQSSDGAKAFQEILKSDPPKAEEGKTQERGGRDVKVRGL